ncbi:type II toxin-antitoxin system VapC family toxin, partial [Rickettsiales bacterium]|nr:type II toxin-antitoxin system VapC family toxin [Rickettsiales bacterium]
MNLLLDTHVLLWCFSSPEKILEKTLIQMKNPQKTIYVSIASLWEISIKQSIGKLNVPNDIGNKISSHRFVILPIKLEHTNK